MSPAEAAVEHWYVYYKLAAADVPALLPRVRALQARIGQDLAQSGLQTRVEASDGDATLMEVYARIAEPAAFGLRLEAALAASDLPAAVRAARRTERFRDL